MSRGAGDRRTFPRRRTPWPEGGGKQRGGRLVDVSWVHWLVAAVGVGLLGFLWTPAVAFWRWSRPARWCLRRPGVYRGLRRRGVRGVRGVSLVGQWFTPAQVARPGWPGPALQLLVGGFGWRRGSDLDSSGWVADAFIRTVHDTGRRRLDYTTSTAWRGLFRLGVEDSTGFVRYARAGADLDEALRYGLGDRRIPYDVFPTLDRAL